MTKWVSAVLSFGLCLFIGFTQTVAQAAELPNVITGASVTDSNGKTPVKVGPWQPFKINFDFSLPNHTVHAGDTTTIELPNGFKGAAPTDFEIKDGANVIAKGKIDPSLTTYTITYTNYAENKSDISGKFSINAQVDSGVHQTSGVLPVKPKASGQTVDAGTIDYTVKKQSAETIIKAGWAKGYDTTKGVWQIKLNQDAKGFANAVIDDQMITPGQTYISGTLQVFSGTWQFDGVSYKFTNQSDVTSQYLSGFTETGTSFRLNIGAVPADTGLLVQYETQVAWTPVPGEKFENKATLTDGTAQKSSKAQYVIPSAGGTGEGYDFTINIKKTDEGGAPLTGAVFDVIRTRSGLSVGQVTTDANGRASLNKMLRDDYTVKETTAPSGYQVAADQSIASSDFSLATREVTKTFVDKEIPKTVDVHVKKVWDDANNHDGLRPSSVTVHLLADGADTGKKLTLNDAGQWQGSFTGLAEKNTAGHKIAYAVSEDPTAAHYTATVTGSAANGFTITNSHTPEIVSIKVVKKWVGPRSGSVSVHLLADGVDTGQSLVLDEAGDWKGAFTDLRKYTADGRQIAYTVSEDPVDGYTGEVTGDMASGFTVTNTNVQTTRVSGTKTWDDDGNRDGVRPDSITVNLLRDGKKVDAVQVSAGADGSWTYAFENLPKYDRHDGHRYDYTVGEDAVKDYATKVDGFDLTNSYTPGKTSVSVSKVWKDSNDKEHRRPKSVKVQLYADGAAQGAPVELSEANHWANTWTGLYQKKSGKSVAYTVKEIGTVDGYTGEVTGDMTSGFTVTNTVKPTLDKPVTPSKSTPDKPVKETMAATGSSLIVPGVVLAVLVVVAAIVGGISLFMRRRGGR
ncbi:Cna B-type domain-containing protein [Bifidobacterium moukalabense]|uniref:Cna B-type domain-containing protein n=1 Tax=Bifidobacterium moukalabense TaxID=1333651 RepID=UPI001BB1E624|nr:Cna B-type domain-containing protein [Bifidobacterium moukalabense]